MTRNDLRILCTALAFAGLMLKGEKVENQSARINGFAELIEAYCLNALHSIEQAPASVDAAIEQYKAKLISEGAAQLPDDRETLLHFYDRLLQRQIRSKQREFYASGNANVIAERILRMVEEEIQSAEPIS